MNSYQIKILLINLFFITYFNLTPGFGQNDTIYSKSVDTSIHPIAKKLYSNYGLIDKKNFGSAAYSYSLSSFNEGFNVSAFDLILGRVPCFQIASKSGQPGTTFSASCIGPTSFSSNNPPLIFVDDILVDIDRLNINPNDIDCITFLNDITALATYGELASNGIILVTTKKGDKNIRVNYSEKFALSWLGEQISTFSGDEYREMMLQHYPNNMDILNLLGSSNTNWQNEIYRSTVSLDHYINISGSLMNIPLKVAIGKTNQDGIIKTSSYSRTSLALSVDPTLFHDYLKISLKLNGLFNDVRNANPDVIQNALLFDPTQQVYSKSSYSDYFIWMYQGEPSVFATKNPLAELMLEKNTSAISNWLGGIRLDYKLHFLPDLRVVFNINQNRYEQVNKIFIDTVDAAIYPFGDGLKEKTVNNFIDKSYSFFFNYSKTIDAINSEIDVKLGYANFSHKTDYEFSTQHISNSNYDLQYKISDENNAIGYFLNFNYLLKKEFLLSCSFRNDDNSKYSNKYKNGNSYSTKIYWDIKKEPFLIDNRIISDLGIDISYGVISKTNDFTRYSFNTIDPKIKRERLSNFTFGIDCGFINDVISLSVHYFDKTTKDVLAEVNSFPGIILTNAGEINNSGVDLLINLKTINTQSLFWNFSYNLTFNKNKIISFDPYSDLQSIRTGPFYNSALNLIQIQKIGYPVNSFFVLEQVYNQNGDPLEGIYVDRSGEGGTVSWNIDNYFCYKKSTPDIVMGVASDFKYKNWIFAFSGRASLGNYVYNNVSSYDYYDRLYVSFANYTTNLTKSINKTQFEFPQYYSNYFVQNASFFKMDYISVGYLFEKVFNYNMKVKVSLALKNAFTISKYKGQDPEVLNGIDFYGYPRPRVFSFGLDFNF